ncbi:MAG: FG-GAP-like repeat-containing protein [Acidobacteriaceae bacterium]
MFSKFRFPVNQTSLRLSYRAALFVLLALSSGLGAAAQAYTTTTIAFTAAGAPVTVVLAGTAVTLTATVTSNGVPVTPGQVKFCDAIPGHCTDIHLLGTAQLSTSGVATFKFIPAVGTHTYDAIFVGTNSDIGSSSVPEAIAVAATGISPSTTTITSSGAPGDYTLTATVSGTLANGPTGSVSFLDTTNANYVLATAPLSVGANGGLNFVNSSSPATGVSPNPIVVADFNGDGIPDIAVGSIVANGLTPGTVTIQLGNGDGTFTPAPTITVGKGPAYMAVGDFNDDGKPDLAVSDQADGTVTILLGNGDGTFTAGAVLPIGPTAQSIAVGDFNGDGNADIAVVDDANSIAILLGDGAGNFTTVSTHPPTSVGPTCIAVGDFNGDGKLDLAVSNAIDEGPTVNGNLFILLGNGDGTFTPAASPSTGSYPESIAVGDFNSDGKLDLAVANDSSNTVSILLGKGDGTFTAAASPTVSPAPWSLSIGDFNGDGIADLAVVNATASTTPVVLLLGNGDGTFTSDVGPSAGVAPVNGAAADFNGDGLTDFAVTDSASSRVSVFVSEFSGQATATVASISPVGTGTHYIDASYTGDTHYASSLSSTIPLTAEPQPTSLSLTAAPTNIASGQQVTLTAVLTPYTAQNHSATGDVTFFSNSTPLGTVAIFNGVASVNTSSLPPGTNSLLAQYAGDTNFAPSSSTASATVATSGVTLTSSANPAPALTPITFTAQVAAGAGGSILFNINGQNITTAPNAAGTSTYTISTLTAGSYPITATWFAPNSALSAQVSLTQVVTAAAAPDFSFTGTNLTFETTKSGTGDLELASLNNFSGPVVVTCNPPFPPNYTCTLQYPSISLTPGLSSVFTFKLSPATVASNHPLQRSTRIAFATCLPLSLLGLIGFARSRHTSLNKLLCLAVLAVLASITTACGPDHFIPITTGTYPITFTATGTSQGTTTPITHTLTLNATLQP